MRSLATIAKIGGVAVTAMMSLFMSGAIAWAITYFLIDGSEPENPGTDLGAGIAFLGLSLFLAPIGVIGGGALGVRFLFKSKENGGQDTMHANLASTR